MKAIKRERGRGEYTVYVDLYNKLRHELKQHWNHIHGNKADA